MVSLRRHFVPNPVLIHSTGFRVMRQWPFFIHTRYDGLDRLTSAARGNGSAQSWDLDSLGNWAGFTSNGGTQTRQADAANEITSASGWATPQYDAAGNMTVTPQPGNETTGLECTYDAWNRLVSSSDGTTTVTYQYDGQGRRIERIVGGAAEHYYYSGQQVVETRQADGQATCSPTSNTSGRCVTSIRRSFATPIRVGWSFPPTGSTTLPTPTTTSPR